VTRVEGSASPFAELTLAECERLLAKHKAGRVALNAPTGPQILPVTYAYYAKTIVFRTSPYGVLSSLERHTRVAFEIDDIDELLQSGWSVVAVGEADLVDDPDLLAELWGDQGPKPWAIGLRTQFVQITPTRLTGRRVLQG
jgi:nitroimidazol reductase NimA-like FMN-containing flavoprotein (pyridoxamine 5'-phosphate oxidase superfamily)